MVGIVLLTNSFKDVWDLYMSWCVLVWYCWLLQIILFLYSWFWVRISMLVCHRRELSFSVCFSIFNCELNRYSKWLIIYTSVIPKMSMMENDITGLGRSKQFLKCKSKKKRYFYEGCYFHIIVAMKIAVLWMHFPWLAMVQVCIHQAGQ